MTPGKGQSDLLEAVLSAPQRVVIVTGPARSGKTSAVLGLYLRHLDEIGRPGCLLIVPNFPAAAWVRRRLLEGSPTSVLIAPAVTTFAGLSASILSASGRRADTLRLARRRLLLARIVGELAAAGQLKALGRLADTPGLAAALDAAIAELKRAAVEPGGLARAVRGGDAKHADLLAVYRRYQQRLQATQRYDVEGQMWLARDVLADRPEAALGYDRLHAVAVDGFTDFTPTQREMLALLSRRVPRMLITLPVGAGPRRRRLWSWTRRALGRLRRALPDAAVVAADPAGERLSALFDLAPPDGEGARQPPPADRGGLSISVVDAPDLEAEVRSAARMVKADLAEGAPSVAVLARDLDAYAEPIQRVFSAHGVRVQPRPGRLDACGVVRYVLSVASLPPEYAFHDVLAVLRSSYFRPSALGEGFDRATAATAEMGVRTANVLGGRRAYGRAFERLARRARAAAEETGAEAEEIELGPLAADPQALQRAGEMIEALLSRVDAVASPSGAGEYVAALRRLIADLEVPAAAADHGDEALVAADLRALQALEELLDDLAAADVPGGRPAELLRWSAAVAPAPPERCESPVAVLDVLDARPLRFDRVYLLGVNERAFPRLHAERCFIDEADRAAWAGRGVVLDRRSDLLCREMLLFYLAATRADRALTVSTLGSDAGGTAHSASAFLADLLAAAGREGIAVRRRHIGPGQWVPPAGELACGDDAVNAAVLAAFGARPPPGGDAKALLARAGEHRPETLRRSAFGLLAVHRRWRRGEVDRFDGRIDDERLLRGLRRRFPGEWTFSATELNTYARCPWAFFATWLLRLQPLPEPELPLTPAAGGSFCHAVLWRVMTALRDRAGAGVLLADVDEEELRSALAEAVGAERRRLAERAVYPRLWDVQTERWRRLLWAYLTDQRRGGQDGPSLYFELGFGLTERLAGRMDAASAPEPVELTAGRHRIRLRGKIDRVDRVNAGLLAVDYKTGALPAAKDIREARDLQLALYAAALEEMFPEPSAGGAYHGVREGARRHFARFARRGGRRAEGEDYDERLAAALATAARYVQAMREGRFDALPDHDCSPWCPYRQICHYADHRAERKTGGPAGGRGSGDG